MLAAIPMVDAPNLLEGVAHKDDAAVWRLDDDRALVATTDFFTPVVDDARAFGAIAAANALSDVYAMGGRPLFALNLLAFPYDELDRAIMRDILAGGAEKAAEAGIPIAGGHSIDDAEPKYGLVVIGEVHPDRVWRNGGARPGDALVLTKPLGVGVMTTAIKRGKASEAEITAAVDLMSTLNRAAAQAAAGLGDAIHAVTDVTGYGLLGHLREMLDAGEGVGVALVASAVPLLEGARAHAEAGAVPGGSKKNAAYVAPVTDYGDGVDDVTAILLADAQTSGGLLIAVAPERLEALLAALREAGTPCAAAIGQFTAGDVRIRVAP